VLRLVEAGPVVRHGEHSFMMSAQSAFSSQGETGMTDCPAGLLSVVPSVA